MLHFGCQVWIVAGPVLIKRILIAIKISSRTRWLAMFLMLMISTCASAQTFWVNADPQVGAADTDLDNLRKRNQLLTDFVNVQALLQPDFALYDGDLVKKAMDAEYAFFRNQVRGQTNYLVHGNHDGGYPNTRFLDAQADVGQGSGFWYSFDYSGWHIVVLPAQSQVPEQVQRDELVQWLNTDLAGNSLPTMVFHHYHFLPCGLSQCEYYTINMGFKRDLMTMFSKHGVRYVFSGHVHAGTKATTKISWSYDGVQYVVLPSPLETRAFGEEYPQFTMTEPVGAWGFYTEFSLTPEFSMTVHQIHTAATQKLPLTYPIWPTEERVLLPYAQLPAQAFTNGNLDGLGGWRAPYRYQTDVDPNYQRVANSGSIRLRTVSKGTAWAHDEFDELYQIVPYEPGIEVRMGLNEITGSGGMFMRVATYNPTFQVIVWAGTDSGNVLHLPRTWGFMDKGERFGINKQRAEPFAQFELPLDLDDHRIVLDLESIYDELYGGPLKAEKMYISFGVWSGALPSVSGGDARFDYVRPVTQPVTSIDGAEIILSQQVHQVFPFGWALSNADQIFTSDYELGN